MQHVIIGTAGHIDHGKTTLIKALTGRETDTLREEKERGISINLGFTYFDLPSGRRAGIVDVPGHEKFIKNMLAGISGIDVVLMVIAADEGVMPQTKEHLNILQLLDIKKGIVVITKKDTVDQEWLKMITEDIKNELKGSFLENAPVIPVSSITGDGIGLIAQEVDKLTADVSDRDLITDFRVPVDRVFTVSGFGTVITGTLISGVINEGDACEIYPGALKTKIRGIQVHEKSVKQAQAGQRVAVNLASVKTDEVKRGDVISKPGSMNTSMMLDCRLNLLSDSFKTLCNRDRIRLYHGTSEILGRVYILDKPEIKQGESALVQLRLEGEIAAKSGDKYIIRSYSPMHTIGGGTILDPVPSKHKLLNQSVIDSLLLKEEGNPTDIIEHIIAKNSALYLKKEDILKLSGKGTSDIDSILDNLVGDNRIIRLNFSDSKVYIHKNYYENLKLKSVDLLEKYHKSNPLKAGISKEEYRNKVFGSQIKQKLYDELIELLKKDTIEASMTLVWEKGFSIQFDKRQTEIKNDILNTIISAKYQPPKPDELIKPYGREEKAAKMVFDSLVDTGEIVKIDEEIYLYKNNFEEAKTMLVEYIVNNNAITAAQFRDLIGASRKYAVALLEYFDSVKLTKRLEDKRVLA